MMVKILLVNGPPRSGKDTVGSFFSGRPNVLVTKFAKLVKEQAHRLWGVPGLPHDFFEDQKNIKHTCFEGLTPREAYIAISERFFKPLFGVGYYGEKMRTEINNHKPGLAVITDSGFVPEGIVLANEFGSENMLMIQLKRKFCTFSDDSRSYVRIPGVKTCEITNDGTIADLFAAVTDILSKFPGFTDYVP